MSKIVEFFGAPQVKIRTPIHNQNIRIHEENRFELPPLVPQRVERQRHVDPKFIIPPIVVNRDQDAD